MDPSRLNRWSSRLLLDEAATLAFMREGPGDIRPAMLLLFHAQDARQFAGVHQYGCWYLHAVCSRLGECTRHDVLEFAAGDALAVMWRRRSPASVAVRARFLGIRNATYSELRAMAIEMYQTRLHEARVRFASGTIYTRGPAYLRTGAHRTSVLRTAPDKAQRDPVREAA